MAKQLLHLVFGGELTSLDKVEFRDLDKVHVVGLYPNFAKAREAWKAAAQATVDNAHMRYFVVHLHKMLQPELDAAETAQMEKARSKPATPKPAKQAKGRKPASRG